MAPQQVLVWCVKHKETRGRRYVVARWNPRTQMYERPLADGEKVGALDEHTAWWAGDLTHVDHEGKRCKDVAIRQACKLFNVQPYQVMVQRARGFLGTGWIEHRGLY